MSIENKIDTLKEYLRDKKCILGFSAGSDSTLLAFILSQVSPESLLVTIDNNMMPSEFIEYTQKKAEELNLTHKIIQLDFLEDDLFKNNRKERCYECRKKMFSNIQKLENFNEYDYFIEGTNITDLLEDRPGILVREMFNMTSPLIECNISKDEVYEMIKYFNLEYSNDTTCIATRIKTNQKVNSEKLKLIENAEKLVKSYVKQENIRVRYDDNNAIITIDNPLEIIEKNYIKNIRDSLKELGFKKVLLDITGYEKTKLIASIDENNNYYYTLPYEINIKKTMQHFQDNNMNIKIKSDKTLKYDDITIEENGKISMPQTTEFMEKYNKILRFIERKKV